MPNNINFLMGAAIGMTLMGCNKHLCVNMMLASTNSNIQTPDNYSKETKISELTTWYVFGFPFGDISSPQAAFNELNQDAVYVNNLELRANFWYLSIPLTEEFGIGIAKDSWTAKGSVVKAKSSEAE